MASRADLAELAEGSTLTGVDLSRPEAVALNRTQLVSVAPDAEGWSVVASHRVGAVRRGDLVVRVRPKVGPTQVLRLLARAHGLRLLHLDDERLGLETATDLTAVLAALFAHEAGHAFAAGAVRGYRTEDQTVPVLRGRLRMRDQHLRRFGLPLPLEVTVDEWSLDTDDNRRIRAAVATLLHLPGLTAPVRRRLLVVDRMLVETRLLPPGSPHPPTVKTRVNARLHHLLDLADVVLEGSTVEHADGPTFTHGFVLDLARLFEALVATLLGDVVRPHAKRSLDTLDRKRVDVDLLIVDAAGERVAVADTKYKVVRDASDVSTGDLFQMAAYCMRFDVTRAALIYPTPPLRIEPFRIRRSPIEVAIRSLDITRPLPAIEAEAADLRRELVAPLTEFSVR